MNQDLKASIKLNLNEEILGIRFEELTRTLAIYVCYLLTAVSVVISQGRRTRQIIDKLVNLYETQWATNPFDTTEPVTLNQSTN